MCREDVRVSRQELLADIESVGRLTARITRLCEERDRRIYGAAGNDPIRLAHQYYPHSDLSNGVSWIPLNPTDLQTKQTNQLTNFEILKKAKTVS